MNSRIHFLFLTLWLLTFSSLDGFGQSQICLGEDTSMCVGSNLAIVRCGNEFGHDVLFLDNPVSLASTDDVWSPVINIGFPFDFYGQSYTQLCIGTNGLLTFDVSKAGGFCAWSLNGTPLPNNSNASTLNAIMGFYQDLDPNNTNSGPMDYQTIGTAPNRKFVALFNQITMFSCTNSCTYASIILYEGTNEIDFNIHQKGTCPTWNSDYAIQGVQNSSGTIATTTTLRNNSVWSANVDRKKYTPISQVNNTGYTITSPPYLSVLSSNTNLVWKNTNGQVFPYNNGVLNISNIPPGVTGFFLSANISCNGSISGSSIHSDTTLITRTQITLSASSLPDTCGNSSGEVSAVANSGTAPFNFYWASLGLNGNNITGLPPGNYGVTLTDDNGCQAVGSTVIAQISSSASTIVKNESCASTNDGEITATMTPLGSATTYLWNDLNAQTTQSAINLEASVYTCLITSTNGCSETVTAEVFKESNMSSTLINQEDVSCHAGNDGSAEFEIVGGIPPYTYSWNQSGSIINIASDLSVGSHILTAKDDLGCLLDCSVTVAQPPPLQVATISPDSVVCPESNIQLWASASGGSSPYIFTWYFNGNPIGSTDSIEVSVNKDSSTYYLLVEEECGSPEARDSTFITFPMEIVFDMQSISPSICQEEELLLINTSSPLNLIDSIQITINERVYDLPNLNTITIDIEQVGPVHIYGRIVSKFGCTYTGLVENTIDILEKPRANFFFSANPTTIFEPNVRLVDASTNATWWEWDADGSKEQSSLNQNPTFTYEPQVGIYPIHLFIRSENQCTDEITRDLIINEGFTLFAPNIFTPDENEYNNEWGITTNKLGLIDFKLEIYNRWGQVIWSSNDSDETWNGEYRGEACPTGTYTWFAHFTSNEFNDSQVSSGVINLMR
jgi:gliding motility-associated-like protein